MKEENTTESNYLAKQAHSPDEEKPECPVLLLFNLAQEFRGAARLRAKDGDVEAELAFKVAADRIIERGDEWQAEVQSWNKRAERRASEAKQGGVGSD